MAVRRIIAEAFREFRGTILSPLKLREFEDQVCEDSYLVPPEKAAKGILNLIENLTDMDLVSSFCDTTENTPARMTPRKRNSMSNSLIIHAL